MRRFEELKLPGQVSRKLESVLKAYGVEDPLEKPRARARSVVPAPAPTDGRILPLSSWWRAKHPTKSRAKVPRPARTACWEAPPKWGGQRPRRSGRATSARAGGGERKSVFDISARKSMLKSFGKDVPVETKCVSLTALQQVYQQTIAKEPQEQRIQMWELPRLAREANLGLDQVVRIKSIFDSFDDDGTGTLDLSEFQDVAMVLLSSQLEQTSQARDRVVQLCQRTFALMDSDASGTIDFQEFLRWYSARSFSESLLLSDRERELRELARQCGLDVCTVDKVKEYFDAADTNRSGRIEYPEFAAVLPRMLKLPAGIELPESRIRHFWQEADTDHDETIIFSEFLTWWCKYLNASTDMKDFLNLQNASIINNFYKTTRNIGHMRFDPRPKQPEPASDL